MPTPPTNVGAGLRVGNAADKRYPAFGGYSSTWYTRTVVPSASTASAVADFATVSGGSWTLAAGPNATSVTIQGTTYIQLDTARVITATGSGASSAAVNITVNGLEEIVALDGTMTSGQPLTQTFSGPSGTATTATTKTFRWIRSVTTDGNTVSGVGIGQGDTLGLPYYVPYVGNIAINYNDTAITASTGFTAGVTTSATATTGDVRGTYALQTAANGSRRFTVSVWLFDPNTVTSLYGVSQYSA
ncbi:MAG: hypothetical protein RL219_949 [Actinomycetota bacterium]|jgi:hypothetical protein